MLSSGKLGKKTLPLDTQAMNRRQLMTGAMRHKHQCRCLGTCGLGLTQRLRSPCWQRSWLPPCSQVSLAPSFLEHEFLWLTSCGVRKDLKLYGLRALCFDYSLQLLIAMKFEALERASRIQGTCLQKTYFNSIKNTSPNRSEVALWNPEFLYLMLLIFCSVPLQKRGCNNFIFSCW